MDRQPAHDKLGEERGRKANETHQDRNRDHRRRQHAGERKDRDFDDPRDHRDGGVGRDHRRALEAGRQQQRQQHDARALVRRPEVPNRPRPRRKPFRSNDARGA